MSETGRDGVVLSRPGARVGRSVRRRSTTGLVGGLVAMVVMAGCVGGSDSPATSSAPSPALPSGESGVADVAPVPERACLVEMPEAWRDVMPPAPSSEPPQRRIMHVDEGGGIAYVAVEPGRALRLEWMPPGGQEAVVVADFADEVEAGVNAVDYDGRYLVYAVTPKAQVATSPWTVYVWDTLDGGEPVAIGTARDGDYPDGVPGVETFVDVLASDGTAAWVTQYPPGSDNPVITMFGHDIETGESTVLAEDELSQEVRTHHATFVSRWMPGSEDLTWGVYSLGEEPAVALPVEFTQSRSAYDPSVGGAGFAWIELAAAGDDVSQTRVWFWPLGAQESLLLLDQSAPSGEAMEATDVSVSDRFLTVRMIGSGRARSYILDLMSMSWTLLPQDHAEGEFVAHPGALELAYAGNFDGQAPATLIPHDDLPALPACAG